MNTRDKGKILENYILEKVKILDPKARLTRASGASYDIADVQNIYFYIEGKNWDKENLILKRKDWTKLLEKIPIGSIKTPMYVFQNKHSERFVVLDIEDFFRICKEGL
jgi:hypothetical protein